MRSTATNSSVSQPLPVEWLERPQARPVVIGLRKARRPFFFAAGRPGEPRRRANTGVRRFGQARAFTLLELIMVVAIIGFLAAMTLPHVGGYNRANTVSSATRQLLDDVARARSRAIANRSTVFMIFVPAYWDSMASVTGEGLFPSTPQLTNLLGHQYMSYALLSSRTVGDQPGQYHPHYLTEWQTLPGGVYFWPGMFRTPLIPPVNFNQAPAPVYISTTNTFNNTTNLDVVIPLPGGEFPFPSINASTVMALPYIAFTPQGTLAGGVNQYIVLTRGSIFYAEDTNGVYLAGAPNMVEAPPGNETNNPCMIKIDWATARPTIVQNQFQ